jgi:hypothetical protein
MRKLSGRSHRRIRPPKKAILNSKDLASHFNIKTADLEDYLKRNNIAYHRDSAGVFWASVLNRMPPTGK